MLPAGKTHSLILSFNPRTAWLRAEFSVNQAGFPGGSEGKVSDCNVGDQGSISGSGRSPGKFHGQRSLLGCNPWGRKESDTTE